MNTEITDYKEVYFVWLNRDTTEGRGPCYPGPVCESETTAYRLAEKKGVMGSRAPIRKGIAIKIDNQWLSVVEICQPSEDDLLKDDAKAQKRAALDKARGLGLSDDDIKALSS